MKQRLLSFFLLTAASKTKAESKATITNKAKIDHSVFLLTAASKTKVGSKPTITNEAKIVLFLSYHSC
jgi:hypothetical protein